MSGGRARSSRTQGDSATSNIRHRSVKFSRFLFRCSLLLQDAAEAALALHGTQMANDLTLSVLISNPERKKERTDADANDREVYVAGLSKLVTRDDLEKLFKNVSQPPFLLVDGMC